MPGKSRSGPPETDPRPAPGGAGDRGRRGPTIRDVARLAGVSHGTVSRVLNGGRYVSPAALAAVRRAVRESGYVSNRNARALATQRANCVAFILSEPAQRLFEDPNFSVLLRGCTQALADSDITLVLVMASDDNDRRQLMQFIRAGHVDGALLVSAHRGDPLFEQLRGTWIPVVACGRPLQHEDDFPFVGVDDRDGARQLTQHLLDGGRRRIATITGPLDTPGGIERLNGYRDVLGRRALKRLVVSAGAFSYEAGVAAMRELLERSPDLDAVFVASDLLAAGALSVLRRAGREVPGDVAVGGFDDSDIALSTEPSLTTVRQPFGAVATEMVRMLADLVDGRSTESRVLPTRLVVRDST